MLFAPRMLKALENEGVETIRPVNLTANHYSKRKLLRWD